MREKPFETPVRNINPNTEDSYSTHVINLKDRLKQKPQLVEEPPEKDTEEKPPNPGTETTNETEESATFDDFEKKITDKLNDSDTIEIAEMIVSIGNVGRLFFLPGIYEGLMYPGQERNDIRDVVRRSIINEQANKPADDGFNNYDKRLFAKWPKLQEAISNVSYTEIEIKTLAKYVARQIGEMTVSVWMHKHMWLLYLLYLETVHAKNVIGGRTNDFFQKKFGLT